MINIEEIGVFHSFIIGKLKDHCDPINNTISMKDVRPILYFSRLRNKMHPQFLKELEGMGLIKIKGRQKIEIL